MLADWVVGMLLEDFGITENDVVKMKHVRIKFKRNPVKQIEFNVIKLRNPYQIF